MKKFPRSFKLLLGVLLVSVLACSFVLWRAHSIRVAEHEAVRALSTSCYIGEMNQPVQFGPGPTLAAYYLWQGPQWLEEPMRSMDMAWFDRIVSIQILYPDSINELALPGLDKIESLTAVVVERPTKDAAYYESILKQFDPKVSLTLTKPGQ